MIKLDRLSKIVSHALRHDPDKYNIELDENGWADLNNLIDGIGGVDSEFKEITRATLLEMINTSSKKRHEIEGNRIRAYYGHSLKDKIIKSVSNPPPYLFHGTNASALEMILIKGILPMKRQYVHLSTNKEDATKVALRRTRKPIILKIKSELANRNGVKFYKEKNNLWLSDVIPPDFIEIGD
ncbi:MAG: RNA 2'-phosphotransferase [Bacteroidota bacterium]